MSLKKFAGLFLFALVVMVTPVYAQTVDQPSPSGGSGQMMAIVGKITEVDFAQGTLTLDNGTQFVLPPSFQYTSFPAIGQEVEVTYVEQGGQKVARSVDVGWQGKSNE